MILPFRQERKAGWHLAEHLADVEWAINLRTSTDLFFELRRLYAKLERYGVTMPEPPVDAPGLPEYEAFWPDYHRMVLTKLRAAIQDGTFDSEQWNTEVAANERHLMQAMEWERERAPSPPVDEGA